MRRWHILIACVLLLASCDSTSVHSRSQTDAMLFGPSAMRIHPIFTQVKDWTGDDHVDGIEALIELQDQFGDPTKASGRVIFELFNYRPQDPDPRGDRITFPWIGDLSTLEAQRDRWNRTSRTYGFQLASDQIRDDRFYVLTAEFELSNGGRFFDRIILEPKEPIGGSAKPTNSPSTAPTTFPGF
ncbi:MAG TPA: hypothetical protein VHD56_00985 [Tepidisphaeraceae bacterium]|nr:hypothetical protein [Tepidisphaeraceae bacterium]